MGIERSLSARTLSSLGRGTGLLKRVLLWVWCVRLVQDFICKTRVVSIAATLPWPSLLRANTTLLLAVNSRVVRINVVGILARFATVNFNILCEIPHIFRCVVLIVCDLRVTQMRVTVQIVMVSIRIQTHFLCSF